MKLLKYGGFVRVASADGLFSNSVIGTEAEGNMEFRGHEVVFGTLNGEVEVRFKLGSVSKFSRFLGKGSYEWTDWKVILLNGNPVVTSLNGSGMIKAEMSDDRKTMMILGNIEINGFWARRIVKNVNLMGRAIMTYSGSVEVP